MSLKNIARLTDIIDRTINTIEPPLGYDRLIDALIKLCEVIKGHDADDMENVWYIESRMGLGPADILGGAYWHFIEWHDGRKGYECLSAIGQLYKPGPCSNGPASDTQENDIYNMLENMAEEIQ